MANGMTASTALVFRRELAAMLSSPLAFVFVTVFLLLSAALTFRLGGFLERGQADLQPFFGFHPWLYLFLAPAMAMRLWAEEWRSGSAEFLLALPLPSFAAVLGKFLAAWALLGIALALTAPLWITVNLLGDPDNGAILAGYLGSWLMAGGYLAVGACLSASSRSQVVAFVLAVSVCFLLLIGGSEFVQGALGDSLPPALLDSLASFSFLTHFESLTRGVVELRALVFFITLIGCALLINLLIVEIVKGR
jgi:ABC-2 type transport system permease protein